LLVLACERTTLICTNNSMHSSNTCSRITKRRLVWFGSHPAVKCVNKLFPSLGSSEAYSIECQPESAVHVVLVSENVLSSRLEFQGRRCAVETCRDTASSRRTDESVHLDRSGPNETAPTRSRLQGEQRTGGCATQLSFSFTDCRLCGLEQQRGQCLARPSARGYSMMLATRNSEPVIVAASPTWHKCKA
jgi:hypothetical protein